MPASMTFGMLYGEGWKRLEVLEAVEVRLLLDALAAKYGHGYAADPTVAKLQAKLSVLLEAAVAREAARPAAAPVPPRDVPP